MNTLRNITADEYEGLLTITPADKTTIAHIKNKSTMLTNMAGEPCPGTFECVTDYSIKNGDNIYVNGFGDFKINILHYPEMPDGTYLDTQVWSGDGKTVRIYVNAG